MKKSMKTRVTAALLAVMILLALVSCGEKNGGGGQSDDSGSTKDSFTVAIAYNPQGLDPTNNKMQDDFNVMNAIYDTLIYREDENGAFAPRLATAWEWNSETTMTFDLRDDVYFSNGEKLTAEDVAFSIASGCVNPDNKSFMEPFDPETTVALNAHTVQIGFKYPFSGALSYLSSSRGSIVCKALYEEIGGDAYAQRPVGTGMFVFESWIQGDSLTLKRNEDYWNKDRIPAYSTLRFRVISEASVRAAELEAGGVDAAFDIVSNDFDRLKENPNLSCFEAVGWTHSGLQFNSAHPKFQDIRIREAICIALDFSAIVNAVYGEYGEVCSGLFSSAVQDFKECGPYQYDPERAKALLAEAGYPNGIDIEICLGHTGNIVECVTLAQEYWKQVGINATINQMETVSMIERNNAGVNEISSSNTTVHSGTAGDALKKWSSTWVGALHMNDPYIDEMLEKGLSALDPVERKEIYAQLQQYMWDGCYEMTFVFPKILFVSSAKVSGLDITPNAQILDYSTITVEQ